MAKRFAYVSSFEDRHGKRRYRFRRKAYAVHYFKEPFGTKAFEREYAACLDGEPAAIGATRLKPGSVADVIGRYYADNAFLDLRLPHRLSIAECSSAFERSSETTQFECLMPSEWRA